MEKYEGYLIDLDGTMFRGEEVIVDAPLFIQKLVDEHIPYLFVTNNSSKTPAEVAKKLNAMNIKATEEHVFTTSMATANFVREQKAGASCYVIGEEGIKTAVEEAGLRMTDEDCDFVIFGIDRDITYEKLAKGCLAIRNGATFISTNGDVSIPSERGLLPGNGALTAVLSVSTNQQPIFIGKPEKIIVEQALKVLGTKRKKTLMVGDNYDTDIMAGINAGIDTLMVFTGVTPFHDYAVLKEKPTHYVHHLQEWMERI
ncbi:TIGR01457 family HAD-type hydrolase [Virgibacillus halophilus]|uniref:Acid sugar phosphatase n=1 Tax=Tigheibacillus halophilus TaxID=361280 RepID=A0ABU5C230_9BACI|nr:TIGR01457 family HAD-type hydrolase [Virgibacillus halophilus]